MNKRSKIYFTLLAIFTVLLILLFLKFCTGDKVDINALNNNISKLRNENTRLNKEYLTSYKKVKELEETIREREREVERLKRINILLRRRALRPLAVQNASRRQNIRYQQIIDRLRKENKTLLARNNITSNKNKALERENNRLRLLVTRLTALSKKIEKDNKALRDENTKLKTEVAKLKKENPGTRLVTENRLLIKEIEKLKKENAVLKQASADNTDAVRLREENTRLINVNKKLKEASSAPPAQIVVLKEKNAQLIKEIERLKAENNRLKEQTSPGSQAQNNTEIKRLKEENVKYLKQIEFLRTENSRLKSGRPPVSRASGTARERADNARINNVINELKVQNTNVTAQNNTLKQENARLTREIERIRSASQTAPASNENTRTLTLTKEIERLKKENAALKAGSGNAGTDTSSRQRELEAEIKRLKEELAKLKNRDSAPNRELILKLERLREENARLKERAGNPSRVPQDNSGELNRKLENARGQITTLRNQLNQLKTARENIIREAGQNRRPADTSAIDNRIKILEREIVKRETLIKEYRSEIARLKKEMDKQKEAYQKIIEGLRRDINTGNIRTRMEGSSIRMIFMNEILFSSASTRISAKGASILRIIGNQLKKLKDRDIYVEGHTDSNPVLDWRIRRYYPTNWEFSVVRATRVSRFLIRELKINPKRITAAGRGEYMPRASNTTPRGRAVNRRIEILISPKSVILENRNRELRRQKVSTETIPVRR